MRMRRNALLLLLVMALSSVWAAQCDFDGDEKTDITAYHGATGTWYIRGTLQGLQVVQWGWSAAIPVPGDYDGDQTDDVAVFHPASGNWYIRYSGGGVGLINWGWKDVWPVQADYDGDGITDIAVFYPLQAMWFIRYSGQREPCVCTWGWADVLPTPWDYDHDGMTDIAFYNRAEMPFDHWHIRLSSGPTNIISWGSISSIPVPANYLGDEGIATLGIYRSLSSEWIVTGSPPATVWGTYRVTEPVSGGDYDGDGYDDKVAYNPETGEWAIRYANPQMEDEFLHWGWSESTPVHLNYILLKLGGYSKDLF
ncbi:MAG: VCBS repeat-containing protein [Spartobacteria bacterium]|nr:VCBS repeat-containing protein [Spartobacteria bacterium]